MELLLGPRGLRPSIFVLNFVRLEMFWNIETPCSCLKRTCELPSLLGFVRYSLFFAWKWQVRSLIFLIRENFHVFLHKSYMWVLQYATPRCPKIHSFLRSRSYMREPWSARYTEVFTIFCTGVARETLDILGSRIHSLLSTSNLHARPLIFPFHEAIHPFPPRIDMWIPRHAWFKDFLALGCLRKFTASYILESKCESSDLPIRKIIHSFCLE